MSSELLTIEAAAAHLGVSERTVRKFISDGFLSTRREAGSRRKWLLPVEVEELRVDRVDFREGSRLTRREFMKVRSRVRQLESQMEVVLRMLDAKSNPLKMGLDYAKKLHAACLSQIQKGEWTQTEISSWIQVFLRLSEEDLKTLRDATDDVKPWVPYLRLCLSMTARIVSMEEYETSLDLQDLHREMAEARRRLRVSAMCYSDLYSYDLDPMLTRLGSLESSVQDTLSHVLRKSK
jgi:hypothetical protein